MAADKKNTITIPDIGTDDEVTVIEVNVSVGDAVQEEDALITLESEKASMEVPSPGDGIVKEILVKVGDNVKTGAEIIILESSSNNNINDVGISKVEDKVNPEPVSVPVPEVKTNTSNISADKVTVHSSSNNLASQRQVLDILIPDIGTDDKVDVIEINVKPGDLIEEEGALITLESEKASMEVPSPHKGVIKEVKVAVGDKVATGDLIVLLESGEVDNNTEVKGQVTSEADVQYSNQAQTESNLQSSKPSASVVKSEQVLPVNSSLSSNSGGFVYASPSIRRFANELGVDLTKVIGAGRKGRIIKTDIEQYVKDKLSGFQSTATSVATAGVNISNNISQEFTVIDPPKVNFDKFGEIEQKPFNRIKKLTASNLHRNWVMVPHVTQFDEADITDLEQFRQKHKKQAQEQGYKLTPLVFIMKAVVQALKTLPQFNVSIVKSGKDPKELSLVYKKYYHIGVAIDTPNGLVVPVIRNVDSKGLFQLAKELGEISKKARDGKLTANDMQGGCFTISSLGGIGGTAFTPIVNMPEVAILGVSKSQFKPVYINKEFVPRLMLPLCLSYDHRAIDGADAARFITGLNNYLSDITKLLL